MPQPTARPDIDLILRSLDDAVADLVRTGRPKTITAEQSFAADAMRWRPGAAQDHASVDGLLIPVDSREPMRQVTLPRSADGSLRPALAPYLGSTVDAATCLPTVDFLTNNEGHSTNHPHRHYNRRASGYRIGLWSSVVNGEYPSTTDDVRLAHTMLELDPRHLPLFGPVVVVGVDPHTGGWLSTPEPIVEELLETEALTLRIRALLRRVNPDFHIG
ncbi:MULTISPECIES: hypothetical protein [Amycolatopsis]|uniref:Uncharacterized protein n=1 Tax=Amycolatopsis saalfeldensis TaxID=394193 RepID=A0A1H8YNA8_9PSEU|nr:MULTISPECIES: hypothetical protein [Amycolatopsis]SEP53685.1 hypothetical protein SAMN04489732_129131 [Amycolatopsis saalfeldensis]